jgi:hypothetical protein
MGLEDPDGRLERVGLGKGMSAGVRSLSQITIVYTLALLLGVRGQLASGGPLRRHRRCCGGCHLFRDALADVSGIATTTMAAAAAVPAPRAN